MGTAERTNPVRLISNGFSSRSLVSIDNVSNKRPVSGSLVGESHGSSVIVSVSESPAATDWAPSGEIVKPSPATSAIVRSSWARPMFSRVKVRAAVSVQVFRLHHLAAARQGQGEALVLVGKQRVLAGARVDLEGVVLALYQEIGAADQGDLVRGEAVYFLANVLTIKGQAEALARTSQQVRGGGEGALPRDQSQRLGVVARHV
mgnify:CR=1 FL=1